MGQGSLAPVLRAYTEMLREAGVLTDAQAAEVLAQIEAKVEREREEMLRRPRPV